MNEAPANEDVTNPENPGVAFANIIFAQMRLADNDLTKARQFGILLSCVSAFVDGALAPDSNIPVPVGFPLLQTGLNAAREYLSSIEDWVPAPVE